MITIIGPTASGKTKLATNLAYRLGSSAIISADSRQVYRGMDLGTGKDLSDYQVEGVAVPYYLIDIMPAGSRYNLFNYQHDFHQIYQQLLAQDIKYPILCGGTGLYVEAVLRGYHLPDVPANGALREELKGYSLTELKEKLSNYQSLHNTTDLDSAQRAIRAIEIADYIQRQKEEYGISYSQYEPIDSLILCLDIPREERRTRISNRLKQRLQEGMTTEVEELISSGVSPEDLIYYGLEYKFVTNYVLGRSSYQEMAEQLEIAIHQFAKRQMTWFRGMERRGFTLQYIDGLLPLEQQVEQALKIISEYTEG